MPSLPCIYTVQRVLCAMLIRLLLVLLMLPAVAGAQVSEGKARLDSLLAVEAKGVTEDSTGVRLLGGIAQQYLHIDPTKSIAHAERMLSLSRKIKRKKGEAHALNMLGEAYTALAEYPKAMDYLLRALAMFEALEDDAGIAFASTNIGHVYWAQRNSSKALEYHQKAFRISERTHDTAMMIVQLVHLGSDYSLEGDYDEALRYHERSLALAEATGAKSATAAGYSNIGDMYIKMGRYPQSLAYKHRALRGAQETGSIQNEAVINGGIGIIHYMIAQDSVATPADSLVPAGKAANLSLAVQYLEKSIEQSEAIRYLPNIPTSALALCAIYTERGDYKQALEYYQLATTVRDSMYSLENASAIARLETGRELALKDKDVEIARLSANRRQLLNWVLAAGVVLMGGLALLMLRNTRQQKKANLLLAKEKKRSEDLLLNILPAEVAEELKDRGEAVARHHNAVSVLFTDFAEFTNVAERLSPEGLVRELHECFTAFDAIVERNGLEKIKTIGDAYMAVCGLPNPDARHAHNAVQAALEIRDFVGTRLAAHSGDATRPGSAFRIRIGVNSGPVVAGIVGVRKFAYDIWGDAVNLAARMEQHGEPGKINISQSTWELVKDEYPCEYRGKIAAKHKGEVEMYFVESRTA